MIKTINIREIILEILMEITEEEEYSHIAVSYTHLDVYKRQAYGGKSGGSGNK